MEEVIVSPEEAILQQTVCPHCQQIISSEDYFCPHCGKKIKDKPMSTSVGRQIIVYTVSVLFSPFGLPWAFRYLKQDDQKAKTIGWIIILLTTISLIINVWLVIGFINRTTQEINRELNAPLNSIYTQ